MGEGGIRRRGAGLSVVARPSYRRGRRARSAAREWAGDRLPGQGEGFVQVRGRRLSDLERGLHAAGAEGPLTRTRRAVGGTPLASRLVGTPPASLAKQLCRP